MSIIHCAVDRQVRRGKSIDRLRRRAYTLDTGDKNQITFGKRSRCRSEFCHREGVLGVRDTRADYPTVQIKGAIRSK